MHCMIDSTNPIGNQHYIQRAWPNLLQIDLKRATAPCAIIFTTSFFNTPTERFVLHVASVEVAIRMVNIIQRKYYISVVYRILWVGLCGFVLPARIHTQSFASLKASIHYFPSHSHIKRETLLRMCHTQCHRKMHVCERL